jgi:hypothetical protein
MRGRANRTRLTLASLLLLLGLVLVAPAIILAVALTQYVAVGFDPTTLRQLELVTGAGILIIASGAVMLRSACATR